MVNVRLATAADLKAIHKIEMECFGDQGVTLDQLRWILEKQGDSPVLFLALATDEEDQAPMGFICWKVAKTEGAPHFEILDLAVAKLYRREGVAEALLQDLIQRARDGSYLGLSCYLSEGNPPAMAFYEKNGFVVQQLIQKYYSDGSSAYLLARRV